MHSSKRRISQHLKDIKVLNDLSALNYNMKFPNCHRQIKYCNQGVSERNIM